ncbi:MAG: hypothetical protein DRR06_06405 [Gammaproteobacteria bacterium]|nr:MAG: hypothetical protein DRR06_06405 [Gammaproteobacteria bacterium]RLA46087.1 MAG: hypothetical protein DRR42_18740 [Gammaproteobacteria bacterium]
MTGRVHPLVYPLVYSLGYRTLCLPLGALAGAVLMLVLCLSAMNTRADFINLTGSETAANIAEIYVLEDRVKLVLEVYIGDLETFEELVPDDWMKDGAAERPTLEARMRHFSEHTMQVVTDSGEKLPARFDLVEPRARVDRKSAYAGMINPFTRQRVPGAPADKRVLYVEISYPFEQRPAALTFIPPQDDKGNALVNIGFIAYHKAVPIIDFRYLGAPARVVLDWDDPWYTRFDNPNLKRHHKSALMSFLYVEPYEVRHEILTRVKDLGEWMDLGLRGDEYIELDELEGLKQRIGEFLLQKNPVLIDGKAVRPILDRTNYVKVSLTGIKLVEIPERLEISTAIVGVIITYLTDGLPQQVTVDWELFTDQVQSVPATATDPAGPLPTFLTPDDNVHSWTNFLKNYTLPTVHEVTVQGSLGEMKLPLGTLTALLLLLPLGGLLVSRSRRGAPVKGIVVVAVLVSLGGVASYPYTQVSIARPAAVAGELGDEQSRALLQALLKNVYRAFDFRDEEDVYDKLALTVKGDLLAELYLQNRKSFAIKKAGGAQAKIKSVEIQQAQAKRLDSGALGYAITGRWTALGSVGHWGHTHMRKNLYDAVVIVEAINGRWKITDLELLEERRIDPNAPVTIEPEVE